MWDWTVSVSKNSETKSASSSSFTRSAHDPASFFLSDTTTLSTHIKLIFSPGSAIRNCALPFFWRCTNSGIHLLRSQQIVISRKTVCFPPLSHNQPIYLQIIEIRLSNSKIWDPFWFLMTKNSRVMICSNNIALKKKWNTNWVAALVITARLRANWQIAWHNSQPSVKMWKINNRGAQNLDLKLVCTVADFGR